MNIVNAVKDIFENKFQTKPALFASPGRVNLIGEHTDYNEGFILPAAIDKAVYVAVSLRNDDIIHLHAVDFNEDYIVAVKDMVPVVNGWSNYILGVVDQLLKNGYSVSGFNMVIQGNVPSGAGLSSSAALECAVIFALNDLLNLNIPKIGMVKMAQLAEHTYAGVKCGIMDQFASMMSIDGHVIRLDCRSLKYEYIPFDFKDISVVLFNTQVTHNLASSEYNIRREECEAGVAIIKKNHSHIRSLRDVTLDWVEQYLEKDTKIYNRCKFITGENQRLLDGCDAIANNDLATFGKLMFETHEGLSKLYEVSCQELDFLVDAVKGNDAVLGSRMMGGGFGGCTINLVKTAEIDNVVADVTKKYEAKYGITPPVYICTLQKGTYKIEI